MSERVRGEQSLFESEQPEKCPNDSHARWRAIQCDGKDDVVECSRCGKQRDAICNFDEEYA